MEIGITDFYGYKEPFKKRFDRIKACGFTCVMMSNDKRYKKENGPFAKRVKYAKKIGLGLASLHASYDNDILKEFTFAGKTGDKIERLLKKEIKLAKKYGFKNLVVHIKGECSQVLLDRINRLLKVCEKCNVNFAVENIRKTEIFDYIHANIKHERLKFCYDCGHNHCFCPDKIFFPEYARLLTCVHLHDNDGSSDQHKPFGMGGNIDLDNLAKNLASTNLQSLDFEILSREQLFENPDDLLKKVYENAKKLEKLVTNYRNKN